MYRSHPAASLATATALIPASVLRIERKEMVRVLGQEKAFSEAFVAYLLATGFI